MSAWGDFWCSFFDVHAFLARICLGFCLRKLDVSVIWFYDLNAKDACRYLFKVFFFFVKSFEAETLTKIYETNVEIENHKTVQLASVLTSLPFIFVTSKLNAVARIISCMNSIITSLGEY